MPHGKPHNKPMSTKPLAKPLARPLAKSVARPMRKISTSPISGTNKTMGSRVKADLDAMRKRRKRKFTRNKGMM